MPIASLFPSTSRTPTRSSAVAVLLLAATASASARSDADAERSRRLFAEQCALCHDEDGRAQNPFTRLLNPAPRDFGDGLFQLASGDNGVPMIQDLERVIEHGLPGSGMPAFPDLSASDRRGLAEHVRRLAIEAIATRIEGEMRSRGETIDRKEALALAEWEMTPEEPDPFVSFPPANEETLALGRRLYVEHCGACHGATGGGRSVVPTWRDFEFIAARDLRKGILKGGAELPDLARRIRAGMPGRGMPPTLLGPGETEALAVYLKTFLPNDAAPRMHQKREKLAVARTSGALPGRADEDWSGAREVRLVLTPLSSRGDAFPNILEAYVAAIHDGGSIAIRVRWKDETRDDRAVASARLPDGVAIQFSTETRPPVMGMGSFHHPQNLWHWRAFDPDRIASFFDLLRARGYPQSSGSETSDASIPVPPGLFTPSTSASSSSVEGPGSASPTAGKTEIEVVPTHVEGEWQVIFRRALAGGAPDEVSFAPGKSLQFCIAVWNGAAGDYGPRKSISIWNTLTLDP